MPSRPENQKSPCGIFSRIFLPGSAGKREYSCLALSGKREQVGINLSLWSHLPAVAPGPSQRDTLSVPAHCRKCLFAFLLFSLCNNLLAGIVGRTWVLNMKLCHWRLLARPQWERQRPSAGRLRRNRLRKLDFLSEQCCHELKQSEDARTSHFSSAERRLGLKNPLLDETFQSGSVTVGSAP